MNLRDALVFLLNEYPFAKQKSLSANPIGAFVRSKVTDIVKEIINDPRYTIKGSVGQGSWANSPWVAIFDKFVTNSVKEGYYPVYIVAEDCSGIYLTLNQGVTFFIENYRSSTKHALEVKALDYLAQLGSYTDGYITGKINLKSSNKNGYVALYESAAIVSKYYPKENIPDERTLIIDLISIMKLYNYLLSNDDYFNPSVHEENFFYEDPKLIRLHKRVERNTRLSKEAKRIHGTVCEACESNMKDIYGSLGDGYIEAHHLRPIASIHDKIRMDPKIDFAVLCPNCHAMIHRSKYISDIENFKKILKKK